MIQGVSSEAVRAATGEGWEHWLAYLDGRGGTDRTHKELVALLREAGVSSGWWRQMLANGYEVSRGLRKKGQTADAGFQIGVQRVLPVDRDRLWAWLVGPEGRPFWIGRTDRFALDKGAAFRTAEGIAGEIRSVRPGERLRLTYEPAGARGPTTLQLSLICPRNQRDRTTLRFHHEKLPDERARTAMQSHWRTILDRIAGALRP